MKFTATFAVLAVFVTKAVVSAAPVVPSYDSAPEARSDFVEGALEEVWARFYDELVEEREYDEDTLEFREYDKKLFERAPMKKFGKDVVNNLAQNAHGYAKQYSESKKTEARNSGTRPFMANPAHRGGSSGGSSSGSSSHHASGKKRSLDADEELFERAPMKKFVKDVANNLAQNANGYAKQHTNTNNANARNNAANRPFSANPAHRADALKKYTSSGGSSSGKKRSLDVDEEVFERAFGRRRGYVLANRPTVQVANGRRD
ncbi:hypothetical protein BKA70DRAFT_1231467 [Coprinopsis sp. MPI-PUGE-AT-0042]|nr:hypothetical protein BKA70DRAFT_1231467 [Coprinopsis sp. MPI-PUGE-AT-0042]